MTKELLEWARDNYQEIYPKLRKTYSTSADLEQHLREIKGEPKESNTESIYLPSAYDLYDLMNDWLIDYESGIDKELLEYILGDITDLIETGKDSDILECRNVLQRIRMSILFDDLSHYEKGDKHD